MVKIEELFSELEAGVESFRQARRQLGVYRQSLLKQAFEGKLWQYLKGHPMAGFLTNDGAALTERLLESLAGLLVDSQLVWSVCAVPTFNRK